MNEAIIVDKEAALTVITLNRAEVLNAFDWDSLNRLQAAIAEFEADPSRKAMIITGTGKKS